MSTIEADLKTLKDTVAAIQKQQEENAKAIADLQEAVDAQKAEIEDQLETAHAETMKKLQEVLVAVSEGGMLEKNQQIIFKAVKDLETALPP